MLRSMTLETWPALYLQASILEAASSPLRAMNSGTMEPKLLTGMGMPVRYANVGTTSCWFTLIGAYEKESVLDLLEKMVISLLPHLPLGDLAPESWADGYHRGHDLRGGSPAMAACIGHSMVP